MRKGLRDEKGKLGEKMGWPMVKRKVKSQEKEHQDKKKPAGQAPS